MFRALLLACLTLLLSGCNDQQAADGAQQGSSSQWVKTVTLTPASAPMLELTGILRARHEIPQSFQVAGRIQTREVDAGQRVARGEVLFRLDPADLEQSLAAAKAEHAAAEAALAVARADVGRNRSLRERDLVSRQAMERTELAAREAETRRDAAATRLAQAENALDHATLRAEADGLVLSVNGQPGQVVNPAQPLLVLAEQGPREVVVNFPAQLSAPSKGQALAGGQSPIQLTLREISGHADSASRTWQARYQLDAMPSGYGIGDVVKTRFVTGKAPDTTFQVPISAVETRADGPRVWRIQSGQAQPLPVEVLRMTRQHAEIKGEGLDDQLEVIALGTHLLEAGKPVQALSEGASR